MKTSALFGVAGNPPNFWSSEFKKERANSPQWLHNIGLDALEIQCTYGVKMPEERAYAFKDNAKRFKIELSIHAPYYITIGSSKENSIQRSLEELQKALELSRKIGCERIIFHPGPTEGDRKNARLQAIKALKKFEHSNDLNGACVFPEIAGKINALGSLEDILIICEEVENAWPCLDLAHLHAREHGSLREKEDFEKVLDLIYTRLGKEAYEHLHIHLYPVEWGDGGEVTHKAFSDTMPEIRQLSLVSQEENDDIFFRPRFEPFLELIVERNLKPTIICEAKDSQDIGALEMKNYYSSLLEKTKQDEYHKVKSWKEKNLRADFPNIEVLS